MKTTLFLLNVSRAGASIGAGKPAKKAARAIVALERDGEVVLVGSGQDNLRRHPPADDRAELAEDLVGPLVRSCRRALRAIEDPSVFLIELEVDDGVVVTARTVSDVRQDLEVTVRRLLFDWLTRREAIEADAIRT